ncbi:alpha/beta hydrolase family protein [Brevibacterium jeotgali]|uniref:Dipeptidyl aminopeptidase/acylaminoacyl peptidase n=1 Tax=Brevibacterium jeotgali TaxID=1262550 RepID=A0A2H1L275_9MICO|nr:prolyl oligopeptidase family serine peptidase [Brevibacterium jeotgali]TWC02983.1 dipeptidyl aminopeptidase/acylaminoacyl peptidase [Brevibacterium jeotgali]SMY11006.1 Dipeptidyl aminopeptidase/acylaminoacyl peptidase [Brevibacterium jeotgali]
MPDAHALVSSLHTLGRPVLDGDRVLFEMTRPDAVSDSCTTRFHTAALAPEPSAPRAAQRISSGWSDRAFTRAGSVTAHLRAPRSQPAQLWVTGEDGMGRAVTDLPLGATEFVLTPDGTQAYLVARDPEPGRYGTDPAVSAEAEPPRRITTLTYQSNGVGYVLDRPARLVRVPLAAESEPAPAGEIPLPDVHEVLRLDGDVRDVRAQHGRVSVLGHASAPGTRADLRSTVWIVEDGEPRAVAVGDLSVQAHAWIDGDRIALLAIDVGPSRSDFVAQVAGLHIHDVRDGSTLRLTPRDRGELGGDLRIVGGEALCLMTDDGAERLVAVDLADGAAADQRIRALTPATWTVTGFDAAADASAVVTAATPRSCGEVFRVDISDQQSAPVQLTELDPRDWYAAHSVTAVTAGGDVHGWCAIPPGPGPHPVVLSIHGGPFAQYTAAAFDEVQSLLDAGVAVVWSNPRGSAGRGRAWGEAVRGDFAAPAADDVLAVLDAALSTHPGLDAERLGVQGGSYGGYLTAMVIARDHRFAGAIVERGLLDPVAFAGTSDIGGFFGREYLGTDADAVARQSPLAHVEDIRTPCLVVHSEQDLRCPLEQAQQFYAGLLRHGVEAEMLVFPGEDHELSRSGRPLHRISRFEAINDWWSRRFGLPVARRHAQDG